MKAGIYKGVSDIEVEELDLPPLAPDEFVLDISACAICGSDLHAYTQGWTPIGEVMGHEYSGIVAAVGDGVTQLAIGERLAIIPVVPCGVCKDCRAGRTNLCDAPGGHAGGYAEQVVLSERCVHFAVPEGMPMEAAAFLEPVSVAVRAVNRGRVDPAEPVIVVGLGPIGQSIVQILKARGVETVVAIDLSETRLALAGELGADHLVDPADGDTVGQVQQLIGSSSHRGYSFTEAATVFECSGSARVVGEAITGLVRKAGTLVMVALFEKEVSFDPNPLVRKEVSVVGSYAYTADDWTEAFELLRSGSVDAEALISARVPLSRINDAFAAQLDKETSMKVVVFPDSESMGARTL